MNVIWQIGRKVRALLKLSIKKSIIALVVILLPLSLFIEVNFGTSFISYSDEFAGVLSGIYILLLTSQKKISREDKRILYLMMICISIGIISNFNSGVINKSFPVVVDIVCFAKMFLCFIAMKHFVCKDKNGVIIKYLLKFAKALIVSTAFFGTLSLFIDIGMSGEKRYGIPSFSFVFQNEGRCGYIVAGSLAIILLSNLLEHKKVKYEVLAIISMIYTTKGVVYIIIACYILLKYLWRRKNKLKLKNLIPLILGGTIISSVQIQNYLMDFNSPRIRLIRYGFITANRYFPMGSGFATYGSDMAYKYYSKLYDYYGFDKFYGLSRFAHNCLNDCYLGMIVAQMGYLGLILFVIILFLLFKQLNNMQINKKPKALALSIFIGLVVSASATAIIKSSIGTFIFMILGIIVGYSQAIDENNTSNSEFK